MSPCRTPCSASHPYTIAPPPHGPAYVCRAAQAARIAELSRGQIQALHASLAEQNQTHSVPRLELENAKAGLGEARAAAVAAGRLAALALALAIC